MFYCLLFFVIIYLVKCMKTIRANITNEIIIKNSRFITLLIKINSNDKIPLILENIKKQYPKATHYCYAYRMADYQKASDDGEPGGTAGMPMLNVLEKEDIINVLAITIRYFGGIKLGAGGLVRAYSKSVREALIISDMVEVEKGSKILITVTYDMQKNLDYLLKSYPIIDKEFSDKVNYIVLVPTDKLDLISSYEYKIIGEEYIEKTHL